MWIDWINYTDEKLYKKYVVDNSNEIKEEYESEGEDWYDFALVDNSDILELLEGWNGTSLNEECRLPTGHKSDSRRITII
jgi:myosin heavy subunit